MRGGAESRFPDSSVCVDPTHAAGHPELWKDDSVELFLDRTHGHEQDAAVVHVIVNAAGHATTECAQGVSRTFDGLEACARPTPGGWEAWVRIPWQTLGGRPAASGVPS